MTDDQAKQPEETNSYEDMLEMPRHVSTQYAKMSLEMRAAQFAPFAALNGYEEAIQEAIRNHQAAQEEGNA
ncbi:MAG: hypothetical protein MJ202_08770 [Lentisphaeria bacterium]|nr:hypothetical protein [Lentisphaeria bacterium]